LTSAKNNAITKLKQRYKYVLVENALTEME